MTSRASDADKSLQATHSLQQYIPYKTAVVIIGLRNLQALYNLVHANRDIEPVFSGAGRRSEGFLTMEQIIILQKRRFLTRSEVQRMGKRRGRPPGVTYGRGRVPVNKHPIVNSVMRRMQTV